MNRLQQTHAAPVALALALIAGSALSPLKTTVFAASNGPSAPSGLTATIVSSSHINLGWKASTGVVAAYSLERKSGAAAYKEVAGPSANRITWADSGLLANTTYTYRMRAFNASAFSAYSNEVAVSTGKGPTTSIAAPAGLTAVAASASQINLSWKAGTAVTGYSIEYRFGSEVYMQLASVGSTAVTYAHSALTGSTVYTYRIRALGAAGYSAYSTEVSATTLAPAPSYPSQLTATTISSAQINLAWIAPSGTITGYSIERKIAYSGTYAQIITLAATALTYSNVGLAPGTVYTYRIRAMNNAIYTAFSNEASTNTYQPNTPSAPTNFTAVVVSSTQINLSWKAAAGISGDFSIERKSGGAAFAEVDDPDFGDISYANTGLTPATTYVYRIRALNASGFSAYSSEVSVTTSKANSAVLAPKTLTAVPSSSSQISLSWKAGGSTVAGYAIERKTGKALYAQVATVGASSLSYVNSGLSAKTAYTYRIRAYTSANVYSDYSNDAAATTTVAVPAAPLNLTAITGSSSQITLIWKAPAGNVSGYTIEGKRAGGQYTLLATVSGTQISYTNTGLAAGTVYTYRIRDYYNEVFSAYSNEASATTTPAKAKLAKINGPLTSIVPAADRNLTVFDGRGCCVARTTFDSRSTVEMTAANLRLAPGFYVARVHGSSGESQARMIVRHEGIQLLGN